MTTNADDDVIYHSFKGSTIYNKSEHCTYFSIVLFSRGAGIHYIAGQGYPIRDKQLHFLFPGQVHSWETGPGTTAQQISVGKKIFDDLSSIDEFRFIQHNLTPLFRISERLFDVVEQEMEAVARVICLLSLGKEWQDILYKKVNILTSLFKIESEKYIDDNLLKKMHPTVRDFWNLINQYFIEQRSTSWYASQLHISTNYLNILCKRNLKITPSEMILQRVMQEAKQRLQYSDKIVKEIAFDLGFKSLSSFSNFFKKRTGISPLLYRQ